MLEASQGKARRLGLFPQLVALQVSGNGLSLAGLSLVGGGQADMRACLPKTILVVDDQATVRVLVARVLREGGYSVRLASSGAAALYMLASTSDAFDLVLSDLLMRGMNGFKFSQEVRRLRPEMPIGIMAWSEPVELLADARAQFPVLPKEFLIEGLVTFVNSVLGTRPTPRPLQPT